MFEAALQGISLGLILAVMVGPAFFMLLQIALEKSFKEAVYFAVGIALSDAAYIALAIVGVSQVLSNSSVKPIMGYAGAILLIIFGITSFFKKAKVQAADTTAIKQERGAKLSLKGFILNSINPFVMVFWIGTLGNFSSSGKYSDNELYTFASLTILTVLSTDILKAYTAKKLRRLISETLLTRLNKASGIALVAFGLKMLFDTISMN